MGIPLGSASTATPPTQHPTLPKTQGHPSGPLSKVMGLALSPLPTSLSSPHFLVPVPSRPFPGSKCPSTECPHPPHLPSTWKPSHAPGGGGLLPPDTPEAPPPAWLRPKAPSGRPLSPGLPGKLPGELPGPLGRGAPAPPHLWY